MICYKKPLSDRKCLCESVAMYKTILLLAVLVGIKLCTKYLSGSGKNSRQVYKYLATTLAKSQKSTIV